MHACMRCVCVVCMHECVCAYVPVSVCLSVCVCALVCVGGWVGFMYDHVFPCR